MEPMTFLIFAFLFWTPALVLFISGLLSYKKKTLRNILLTLALISFSIPWLLIIGTRIDGQITQSNFEGTYVGQDSLSNHIQVEIKENSFKVFVDNCDEAFINGHYNYVRDYDAFLFYTDNQDCNLSINERYDGEVFLNCDKTFNCTDLSHIRLTKN
jgi:4-amino-4-deoxy-L-arabinose transferase-like glycosyltransferase